MPRPVHAPPTVQFDEVTKGYVPEEKKVCVTIGQSPSWICQKEHSRQYQSQCQAEQHWPLQPEFSLEVHEELRTCNRPRLSPLAAISQHIPDDNRKIIRFYIGSVMINHHSVSTVSTYLEFFQLVLDINCQGWIHGLVLVNQVLESGRKWGQ